LLKYAAKCHFMSYLLMSKNPGKVIRDPRKNPDRHQNLICWSFGHTPSSKKFHKNAFVAFGRYFVGKKSLHTDRRTDGRTDAHSCPIIDNRSYASSSQLDTRCSARRGEGTWGVWHKSGCGGAPCIEILAEPFSPPSTPIPPPTSPTLIILLCFRMTSIS